MKDFKDKTIGELIDIFFNEKYYYDTNEWVKLQSLLLSKMARSKDFSAVSTMIDKAVKREHFQLIEFICSHLNEKWCKKLWRDIKVLISCKDRDARYRGVWLHDFLAENLEDYLNIINCLNDEYQDVRLIAYHWMITKSDLVFNMIKEDRLPKGLSYFYQVYEETSNLDFSQISIYSSYDYSSEYKKAIFFIAMSQKLLINDLKSLVDILDDQDIFDYFHSYLLLNH